MRKPARLINVKKGVLEQTLTVFSRLPMLRYLFAVITVALAVLLRLALTRLVGNGLPTYITFYPAVIVTAIFAGFWPGIVATLLSSFIVFVWVLPPYGVLAIENPVDAVGLILYFSMGVLVSAFAHLYHQTRERAAVEMAASNEALRQRSAALEVALKEMETFSYSVAHDLRSPLRGIDGFSQYLLEHTADRLDAREQDYLRRMRMAAQRMARLIDDLLNLARVGRADMHIEPVELSDLANEIIEELRRRDPERRVTVDITAGVRARGDRGLLRLALEHLLENAWKFTNPRKVALITFDVETREGERVYCVRDNGVGFDMAYVNKLFHPFQRLHTEEEFPGNGIGLALIQRILQRHGGRIWAEAVAGHGATFYFTLQPAAEARGHV